jgi:hypothetical protein
MRHSGLLALALAVVASSCGMGHNYEQTSVYGAAIRTVLISKGLCKDEQDCNHKEMVFAEGGMFKDSPVHINVYNIADPAIASTIVGAARAARPAATVGLELRITASKHLDTPYKQVRNVTIE